MNLLLQNYNSVKVMHKIVECFKNSTIKKANFLNKYEHYYIERVINALSFSIKEDIATKSSYYNEIMALSNIRKLKIGYETMIEFGFNSWDEEVQSLRKEAYELGYKAIGDFIYPVVEGLGKVKPTDLQLVKSGNQEYIKSITNGIDTRLLNEDIWLTLYAIEFLMRDNQILQCKYLVLSLLSLLGLQEADQMKGNNKCYYAMIIEDIMQILTSNLNDMTNIRKLFQHTLLWAKMYGFNLSQGRYENTKWLQIHFNFKMAELISDTKSLDSFLYDEHINWNEISRI